MSGTNTVLVAWKEMPCRAACQVDPHLSQRPPQPASRTRHQEGREPPQGRGWKPGAAPVTAWSFHSLITLAVTMGHPPLPNARLRSSSDGTLLLPSPDTSPVTPTEHARPTPPAALVRVGAGRPVRTNLLFGKGFRSNFSCEPASLVFIFHLLSQCT